MIVAPGCLSRNASASRAVMKSPEMNSPAAVEEEAAVGVAVPRDAGVGLLPDHLRGDVAAVLLDERVRLVRREAAVDLEAQPRRLATAAESKSSGATRPAMPLPASSTTLNGLMIDGSMNDSHLLDVRGKDVAAG